MITDRILYKYASVTALVAGVLMTVMVTIMHLNPLSNMLNYEAVVPATEVANKLQNAGLPIRIILTIDHMFLVFVLATFLLLSSILKNEKNSVVVWFAAVSAFIVALLDVYENHHVATWLMMSLQNVPIPQSEVNTQAILSLAKFHIGNLPYVLLAFFFPQKTTLEKYFRYGLLFVLLPFSVIRYSFQDEMGISVLPYAPIALGFFIASYIFYKRSQMKSE